MSDWAYYYITKYEYVNRKHEIQEAYKRLLKYMKQNGPQKSWRDDFVYQSHRSEIDQLESRCREYLEELSYFRARKKNNSYNEGM